MPDALIWPSVVCVAAIVVGIVALFVLRPALVRLIDRTSKLGKEGAVFERPQESTKAQPALSFEEAMRLPVSASVLDREKTILAQLSTFALRSDEEKIKVLIRAFATTRIALEHNTAAYTIFASQLRLLIALNAAPSGLLIEEIERFYTEARAAFPDLYANRSFDDWLGFVISQNLVVRRDRRLEIAQFGSDFLKHLVDAKLTCDRRG